MSVQLPRINGVGPPPVKGGVGRARSTPVALRPVAELGPDRDPASRLGERQSVSRGESQSESHHHQTGNAHRARVDRGAARVSTQLRASKRARGGALVSAVTHVKGPLAARAAAAADVERGGERYASALRKLTVFKEKHKAKSKVDAHRSDWLEEARNLRRTHDELSRAIQEV